MKLTLSDTYAESQEQQVLLDRLEVTIRNDMAREINRHIREYASAYSDSSLQRMMKLEADHQKNIANILARNIGRVVPRFGKLALVHIERQVKADTPAYWQGLIDRWLLIRGLQEAAGIAETTTRNIRKAIETSMKETASIEVIAKAIRAVSRFTPTRAALIARTESHNAAMFAAQQSALDAEDDLGITLLKFWVPVQDARTRDHHAAMASHQGVRLRDKFNVGGKKMDRPGDPAGGADNVINCRCTVVYRESEI